MCAAFSETAVVEAVVAYFNEPKFAKFFVDTQVLIPMGTKTCIADIVLRDGKGKFIAIAECKSPSGTSNGKKQLTSYLSASDTRFGLLATDKDSTQWIYCENKGASKFRRISKSAFESGVLDNPPGVFKTESVPESASQTVKDANPTSVKTGKPQSTRIWKYVTLVLGIGLALSFVIMLMLSSKPKGPFTIPVQTTVHPIGNTVLIPAGEFQMGSNASNTENDEKPIHTVYVDSYYIDRYEVTNAEFKQFVDANPQWQKDRIPDKFHNSKYLDLWQGNSYPPGKENHPVVYVSWYAAMAYAKWKGKRLPTEAEWERAARGGLVNLKYTWGNIVDPRKANYGNQVNDTTPVGSYPANDYGLYDMVGNVMEWCLDGYETDFYSRSPRLNPIAGAVLTDIVNNFQDVIGRRVVRGGCWYNAPMHVRVADRYYGTNPNHVRKGVGFRCAGSATSSSK